MNRTEKTQWVESLSASLAASSVVIVAHYKGLTVAEIMDCVLISETRVLVSK